MLTQFRNTPFALSGGDDGYAMVVNTASEVTGASGEVTVTDDAFTMPTEDVTITVTFKETAKIAQSITLTASGTKTYGDTSFTLSAADYSGDASNITYTSSDETVTAAIVAVARS